MRTYANLPELPPPHVQPAAGEKLQLLSGSRVKFLTDTEGMQRIVVVANTQVPGFRPADYLRQGDYVLHLNHARHARSCMAVEGTRHAVLVRHNSAEVRGWFVPESFTGFSRVIFVEQSEMVRGSVWFAEWRERSKKSLTTGFIAANLCREKHPGVPLLLLGFDPLRNRGSYRWQGHDWAAEARWYVEKGFSLLPPGAPPVVHQIWLGAPMKEGMQAWVDGVREAACEAGWRHVLWNWSMLRQRFAADPITPWMERLLEVAPTPATYGLVSDYYKQDLMAAPYGAGTLYLDTDIFVTGKWPQMPTDSDLYMMVEQFRTSKRANGAFWLPARHSEAPFGAVCAKLRKRIAELFPPVERLTEAAVKRVYEQCAIPRIIGPYYLRKHCFPDWDLAGVKATIFDRDLLSHLSWQHPAAFTHVGTATWRI